MVVGGDALRLPFREGVFSVVVAAELIEHLPPDGITKFLEDAVSLLRQQGVFVLTTPNFARLSNRVTLLRGKSPLWLPSWRAGETYGHLREYTSSEVVRLMRGAGLEDVRCTTVTAEPGGAREARARALQFTEWILWRAGFRSLGKYLVAWGRRH